MKKYVIGIFMIGIILMAVLFYNIFAIRQNSTTIFYESGYILKSEMNSSSSTSGVERYYFNANESYRTRYDKNVVFKDTEGQEVVTDKCNFIHYSDGAISALSEGVILNLEQIDSDPIIYYNIQAGKILRKAGDIYTIQHLDKELKFTNAIWKIADNKYLVFGESIKLDFNDETTKTIEGYIEIEYLDNQIIKLYNQEATYQTIASNVSIQMQGNIIINLDKKIVSKDGTNKMALDNMVLDSDDNIDIVDLDEYKEDENNTIEENKIDNTIADDKNEINSSTNVEPENNSDNSGNHENGNNNGNSNGGNSGSNNENNGGNNNGNVGNDWNNHDNGNDINGNFSNNGNIENNGNMNEEGGNGNTVEGGNNPEQDNNNNNNHDNEYEYQENITIVEPNFKVENFEVDSIKMTAEIAIEDAEELLSDDTHIRIYKNTTGKKVYEREENLGVYNINIEVATLEPNTEYTLAVESTYTVDESNYTKNFIYKIFRTESVGINITKDYFTSSKLAFHVEIEGDSKLKSAQINLKDKNGEIIQTQEILVGQTNDIIFDNLSSNTDYTVEVTNVIYNGQLIANGFEMSEHDRTLKLAPVIENPIFEIDKRNSVFNLLMETIEDVDNGITSLKYVIYNKPTLGEDGEPILGDPVFTINANKNQQVLAYVNGTSLQRNVDYVYKVIAEFDDNEKIIEYESQISDCMSMAGNPYPTITFEAKEITYERIKGNLIIHEEYGEEIINKENVFTVVYTNSRGDVDSFTSAGSLIIPVDVYGLKANETYRFSIYTKANLQDGNGEVDHTYIGGAVVKTEKPYNLQAEFEQDAGTESFAVSLQLFNEYEIDGEGNKVFKNTRDLEASTLTGLTFNLYAGDDITSEPKATVTITDGNVEAYQSDIKKMCYDNKLRITPSFFRLSNSQIMKGSNYIIEVTDAYDYTAYNNDIPILNSTYQIIGKSSLPDLPTNTEDSLYVTPIYNRDKNGDERKEDLNSDTVVGYNVKAKYDQKNGAVIKEITYNVYIVSPDGDVKIESKTVQVGESGVIPSVEFNVDYGTLDYINDKQDTVMRRGNSYYFTYTMKLEIDGQEINYPYTEETILKSKTQTPVKQLSKIIMYPKTSGEKDITYKYNILDVDHSIITTEASPSTTKMYAYIGNIQKSSNDINIGGQDFDEVKFTNLTKGILKLMLNERVTKNTTNTAPTTIVEQNFEGIIKLTGIEYEVKKENNQLLIYLQNIEDYIDRIGMFDIVFKNASNDEVLLEKKYLKQENNNIKINLIELAKLLKQKVKVELYAYYDTGKIGFELNDELVNENYVAYQGGSNNFYYSIMNNLLSGNNPLIDNIYQITSKTVSNTGITLYLNKIAEENSVTQTISLDYSQSGFRNTDSAIILQKEILKEQIDTSKEHTINIDMISPGIKDLYGAGKIETSLDEAIFSASIVQVEGVTIDEDKVYIDVYETDDTGVIKEETKTTVEKNVSDFGEANKINITNLKWQTRYAMKFRVKIEGKDYYLYDMDAEKLGYEYTFSTLADIEIDNINVEYLVQSYMDKKIHITHTLGRTTGYDKLRYQVYEYDASKKENLGELITQEDVEHIFKNNEEYDISVIPGIRGGQNTVLQQGKIFEFNKKYIIKIVAIKKLSDGREVIIEEKVAENGNEYKSRKEFMLPKLENPNIAIAAVRYEGEESNYIEYRITVSDTYKVIKDGKYTIEIVDRNGNDAQIVDNEGHNVEKETEYSIDYLNRGIRIKAEMNQTYTIKVKTLVDLKNDGNTEEYIKEYSVNAAGDISLGNITAEHISEGNYISLIFRNSYRLTELTKIDYSIYTLDGYSQSGTIDLLKTPLELQYNEGLAYYILKLPEETEKNKNYYIELNGYKESELYQANIEFMYTE